MNVSKMGIIIGLLFLAVLVFWWTGLGEYRDTVRAVQEMRQKLTVMQAHINETERVLAAVKLLENSVRMQREAVDDEIERSMCLSGNERIDRLERLLEADLASRRGNYPSAGPAGGLPDAGGEGGAFAPAESGAY